MTGDIVLKGNATQNLHPVTLQQLNASVSGVSATELVNGGYKASLRTAGKLDIYNNSTGVGVTIDVASDPTVTKIFSSDAAGRGLMLESTSDPDQASSISLYNNDDEAVPI